MDDFEQLIASSFTQAETDAMLDKAGSAVAKELTSEADAHAFGVWVSEAWIKDAGQ